MELYASEAWRRARTKIMNDESNLHNCPNCGAPISEDKCPYCGTRFIDIACIKTDEPFYLKFMKPTGEICVFKVMMDHASMTMDCNSTSLYADNQLIACCQNPDISIEMTFRVCN